MSRFAEMVCGSGEICVVKGVIIFGSEGMVFGNGVIVFESEGIWLGMEVMVCGMGIMKEADFASASCRLASGINNFKE